MPQRLRQPPRPDPRRLRGRQRAGGDWAARTIPGEVAGERVVDRQPTLLGFPAEFAEGDDESERGVEPDDLLPSGRHLVIVRRADRIGGAALVLAGVAANVSLFLSWSPGEGPAGLSLVQRGAEAVTSSVFTPMVAWQPLVPVLSGGLLVLFGLLLLVPARAHRLVGVLALVVSLAAAAAVVVLLADVGWEADRVGPGMWCAIAVPLLGLVGALKAMLTAPLVTIGPR